MNRDEILKQLETDLEKTQARRVRASQDFDEAIQHRPNNRELILSTSKAYRDALEDVCEAVRRKSKFLIDGIPPIERKPPEAESQTSNKRLEQSSL